MSEALALPWRRNLVFAALQLAALTGLLALAARVEPPVLLLPLAALFGLTLNSAYALLHEAEHGVLHPDRRVNDAIGSLLGLFFPSSFHLLRQGHLGHHLRNRSDDEAFDLYFAEDPVWWKWLKWYGILTGGFWCVLVLGLPVAALHPPLLRRAAGQFDRPGRAVFESLNPRYDWLIRLEAGAALLLQFGLAWLFHLGAARWLSLYAGFAVTWSGLQYVHHYATPRDVATGARNLRSLALLDALLLNHNWHLTHHRLPHLPWTALPAAAAEDGPRGGFLRAYLRQWRGPCLTAEHVENRFAGRLIR